MQVNWDQSVAGVPLIEIRDILRHIGRYHFDAEDIAERMRVGKDNWPSDRQRKAQDRKAKKILEVLVASGLIEIETNYRSGAFTLTENGIALSAADQLPRMTRKAADQAIKKLIKKVNEINANPVYMHDVEEVWIFGSYIGDAKDLGDIDVAVKLNGRWSQEIASDFIERSKAIEKAFPRPRSFNRYGFWGNTLIYRHLRVNRRIHILKMTDLEHLECPRLMIYPKQEFIDAKDDWIDKRTEILIVEDDGQAFKDMKIKVAAMLA